MTSNEQILRTLRLQAWERVKAELQSVLQTYWDETKPETFAKMKNLTNNFIKEVEDQGLQE